MKPFYAKLYLLPLLLFSVSPAFGQQRPWQPVEGGNTDAPRALPALNTRLFKVNAALERAQVAGGGGRIQLPDAKGGFIDFRLTENNVLNAATAAAHPEIKTYTGLGPAGEELRLTMCPSGIMGRIKNGTTTTYLQPLQSGNPDVMAVFNAADALGGTATCGVTESTLKEEIGHQLGGLLKTTYGDVSKRTYIISVAATGEYTTWSGSQSQALARIATTVNNVNAIFERDFAITFTVNSPNDILFPNAATDPYATTTSPDAATLNTNHQILSTGTTGTAVTAGSGFNLGHVFNAGWSGGLAYTPSVCSGTVRGGAASGLDPANFPSGPSGPIFDLTVAHEICHQFGGAHTFAGNTGGCSGNTSGATGWEPGSGSTIMAYPGICTGLSYQNRNDPYFHGGNMAQVSTYMITGNGSTCGTTSASGNNAPVLSTTPNTYTIPNGTPFRLRLPATDADGDVLSYNWEQIDPVGGTGTGTTPQPNATSGPQFRSFPPTLTPEQTFPSLTGLLTGNLTYEVLPTVARTLNFRGSVRDNRTGAGRTANKDVTVTTASCGPFSITSQPTATTLNANGSNTVTLTWNTAAACVTDPNINIRFSTDGGNTYPYMVLAGTSNDGTETFTVPSLPTCTGRFMIESETGIFFNISPANITLTSTCVANGATIAPAEQLTVATPGDAALNTTTSPQYGTALTLPITGTLSTTDPASNLVGNNGGSCIFYLNPTVYDSYSFRPAGTGNYTFTLSAGNTNGRVLNLYEGTFDPANLCKNWIVSSLVGGSNSTNITAALCASKQYVLVISSFGTNSPTLPASYSVAVTSTVTAALYTNEPLPAGTNYVWAIVNNNTGNIVEVRTTPDLSNTTTYTLGSYTLYGLNTTSTATAVNTTYAGTPYLSLYNAALNQTGGLCANFSRNSRMVTIGSVPLPVQLLAFGAKWSKKSTAEITWETGREQDVKSYEIERSFSGQEFTQVGSLPATNRYRYQFTDPVGITTHAAVFYRLRIVDMGGQESLSGVVKLDITEVPGTNRFSIVPNPIAGGQLQATLSLRQAGPVSLIVQDVSGQVLHRVNYAGKGGENVLSIDLTNLASGLYLMVAEGQGFKQIGKFVR